MDKMPRKVRFVSTPTDFIAELVGYVAKAIVALGVGYVIAILLWAIFGGR